MTYRISALLLLILSSLLTSGLRIEITEGIKDAKENVNTDKFGDDHVPTLDQDTIEYDTGWMTLTKVTSYDSKTYSSSNDVFDSMSLFRAGMSNFMSTFLIFL